MNSLSLRDHLPFLLSGLSQGERQDFLTAIKPLSFDPADKGSLDTGPVFSSYEDFVERFEGTLPQNGFRGFFEDKLARYQNALNNVEMFFSDVVDVVFNGPDLFYALKNGAGVLVNIDEDSDLVASDVFGAVQYAAQYDEAIDLRTTLEGVNDIVLLNFDVTTLDEKYLDSHTTEEIVVTQNLVAELHGDVCDDGSIAMTSTQIAELVALVSKGTELATLSQIAQNLIDLFCDSNMQASKFLELVKYFSSVTYTKADYALLGTEIDEAMHWYFAKDLAWLKEEDKISIIKKSFIPTVVADRQVKMTRYFNSDSFELHRQLAEESLYSLTSWEVHDAKGRSELHTAPRVEKWLGTDYDMDALLDYFSIVVLAESDGDATEGKGIYKGLMQVEESKFAADEDWSDPKDNIKRGLDDLFGYAMGTPRNKYKSETRGLANYNAGAGNIIKYDKGTYKLTPETSRYLRDYLIYRRFM